MLFENQSYRTHLGKKKHLSVTRSNTSNLDDLIHKGYVLCCFRYQGVNTIKYKLKFWTFTLCQTQISQVYTNTVVICKYRWWQSMLKNNRYKKKEKYCDSFIHRQVENILGFFLEVKVAKSHCRNTVHESMYSKFYSSKSIKVVSAKCT